MLPEYEQHMAIEKKSLFSRIYGVYTIEREQMASVNLILMANTLNFKSKDNLTHIFDLKGSTVSRLVRLDRGETVFKTS